MAPRKRRRREKRSGSVYQLPSGKWQAAIEIDGRIIRRNRDSKQAAEAALKELIDLRERQIDIGSAAQTLSSWLGQWLSQAARDLRPRTIANYQAQVETYIAPALGDMPLDTIRPHHIQAFLNSLVDDIKAHTRYPGTRTALLCALRLKQAFSLAVGRKILRDSPMAGVILPKDRPAKIVPLTEQQIAAFLAAAETHLHAPLWHCYALLGLRKGEGLGLRWQDVNFETGTITIAQQVQTIPGRGDQKGRLDIGKPKSEAGERVLPAPERLLSLLRQHRAAQLELRLRHADRWQDNDLVFCGVEGKPVWPSRVAEGWYRLRDKAGLPTTSKLHHLRHSLATLLDESGATETIKAAILGHAKTTVTQRYTHARLQAMREVLERVVAKIDKAAA